MAGESMTSLRPAQALTPETTLRRALLIGVEEYLSPDFAKIPTIPEDLARLRAALELSDYEVAVASAAGQTKGQIDGQLDEFVLDPVNADATLIVYLSGHGVHVDGSDYVVPSDARSLTYAEQHATQSLVSTNLSALAAKSRAGTIVVFVDACRENLNRPEKAVLRPAFGDGLEERIQGGLVTVYGCDPDGYCYFSEGTLNASIFAAALARALDPARDARSIRKVIETAQEEMDSLIGNYLLGRSQRLNYAHGSVTGRASLLDAEICRGSPDPWRDLVATTPLWSRCSPSATPGLRDATANLVTAAWKTREAAGAAFDDPWDDVGYPERCLRHLERLIADDLKLGSGEVATLIAAPFIREAVEADVRRQFAAADPFDLRPHEEPDTFRSELEATHQLYSRLATKVELLPTDSRDSAAAWLMHQAVARHVGAWDSATAHDLSRQLAQAVVVPFRVSEAAERLRAIAMNVGAGKEALEQEKDSDKPALEDSYRLVTTSEPQALRSRALATLVALAGQLAIDARRLPEVVASHISTAEKLSARGVLETLVSGLAWSLEDDGRTLLLDAACPHPALHLALEQRAEQVEELLGHARAVCLHMNELNCGPLASLPDRVSVEGLRPQYNAQGEPRYETPLLVFRLDHDEIRDLLMGVKLYGDPSLAIRELYQNALDACRYRRARSAYRSEPYTGLIQFRQGEEDGRVFIECEDNGVGMGTYELEQVFSRAGRRFVNSAEFLWEQAKWRRERPDIRLWPNSRFGIGVFSYFMLADEMKITTARVDRRTLKPSEVLVVRISSSGSLFRIKRQPPEGHEGGTVVRLYLRSPESISTEQPGVDEPESSAISCLDALRSFLWYSEFDVRCTDGDAAEFWPRDTVRRPKHATELMVRTGEDAWFLDGEGGLLADGVATDEFHFGYIVNLWRDHAPVLTVDRKRLEAWDEAWVDTLLLDAAERLPRDSGLSYRWLWQLAATDPSHGDAIYAKLAANDVRLELAGSKRAIRLPVRVLGCFPVDESAALSISGSSPVRDAEWRTTPWQGSFNNVDVTLLYAARRRLLMQCLGEAEQTEIEVLPEDISWMPLLTPLEHYALTLSDRSSEWDPDPADELRSPIASLVATAAAFGLGLRELLRRLRPLVILGFPVPGTALHDGPDTCDREDAIVIGVLERSARSPWLNAATRIASIARLRRTTPEALLAGVDRYRDLGLDLPRFDLRGLADHVCSSEELAAMETVSRYQQAETRVGWQDLASSYSRSPEAMDDSVLDFVAELLDLEADEAALVRRAIESEDDLVALSRDLDGIAPWIEADVTGNHLLAAAERLEETVPQVVDRLTPYLGPLSVDMSEPTGPERTVDDELSRNDRYLLTGAYEGEDAIRPRVELPDVLNAAAALRWTVGEVVAQLEALAGEYPIAVEIPSGVPADLRPSRNDIILLSRDLDGLEPWLDTEPSPKHYVDAATETGLTVHEVWQHLDQLTIPVPALSDAARGALDIVPTAQDRILLSRRDVAADNPSYGRGESSGPIDGMHVLRCSIRLGWLPGEVVDRLHVYAPLELDLDFADGEWTRTMPTWRDFVVLSDDLDGQASLSPGRVRDGHVARAATLVEEDEEAVRARLRRYAPLFKLELDGQP